MTKKHSSSILITAGGTGGHVMPALAVRQKLIEAGHSVIFITDPRGYVYIPKALQPDIIVLPLPRYRGHLLAPFRFIAAAIYSILYCLKLVYRFKIEKVVGFGGYVTLPPLIAALTTRRSLILHEQNAVMGRVNRWMGLFADKIALSTPTVLNARRQLLSKFVYTGLPVRPEIEALRFEKNRAQTQDLNILIIGGSQAARFFNDLIPQSLALLSPEIRKHIKIHHQCQQDHLENTRQVYESLGISAHLLSFFEDMPAELHRADLVFARAGASTISEISIAGKATFFIPFPHAMEDHQTINAQLATQYGGGWWQAQSTLTAKQLAKFIRYAIKYPQVLQFAGEEIRRYGSPHATHKLEQQITDS